MNYTSNIRTAVKEVFSFDIMHNDRLRCGRRLKFVTRGKFLGERQLRAIVAMLKMRLNTLRIRFTSVELVQCKTQQYNLFYHAIVVIYPENNAPQQLELV
jgi:hypothetical protein